MEEYCFKLRFDRLASDILNKLSIHLIGQGEVYEEKDDYKIYFNEKANIRFKDVCTQFSAYSSNKGREIIISFKAPLKEEDIQFLINQIPSFFKKFKNEDPENSFLPDFEESLKEVSYEKLRKVIKAEKIKTFTKQEIGI